MSPYDHAETYRVTYFIRGTPALTEYLLSHEDIGAFGDRMRDQIFRSTELTLHLEGRDGNRAVILRTSSIDWISIEIGSRP